MSHVDRSGKIEEQFAATHLAGDLVRAFALLEDVDGDGLPAGPCVEVAVDDHRFEQRAVGRLHEQRVAGKRNLAEAVADQTQLGFIHQVDCIHSVGRHLGLLCENKANQFTLAQLSLIFLS